MSKLLLNSSFVNSKNKIPNGKYFFKVKNSNIVNSKDNFSKYAEFDFEILHNAFFSGKKFKDKFAIQHQNIKIQNYEINRLKYFMSACNLVEIKDTTDFHNLEFQGEVNNSKNGYQKITRFYSRYY